MTTQTFESPTLMHLVTVEGLHISIDMEDIDYMEVLDEGLTDDDYLDAQEYAIVTKDGAEYHIDLFDNLYYQNMLWDMFNTM
ncbi:hypothetical protein [Fischerella thermalis]|uniref:hypothetical protein n=1 Tax=Fischerella thermalis TaxID=372787 RepID=UPI000C7FF797|nr:hypothetical protein [Fischerella thermalis]RDH52010.1 hypothetical protein CBF18_01040 [Mastigocladus laminosus WC112]PLZ05363.1 hypothetical protein CBP18_20835 [Fischerella thermalis WC119]PLZ06520.1 hypothetical protein CBP17_18765 [Fischerella thermalis WC114]PLZ18031.1 hypothetical protein CBP30_17865 [Fischerella thermalis WC157]PLZ71883.1 hypothetical protein CBP14_19225 [Fischerella thermalis WC245]